MSELASSQLAFGQLASSQLASGQLASSQLASGQLASGRGCVLLPRWQGHSASRPVESTVVGRIVFEYLSIRNERAERHYR